MVREVGRDLAIRLQAVLFDCAHYTHNGDQLLGVVEPQVFSNRIAVRPEPLCEFLVDDHHLRLVRVIILGEKSALPQWNLHRPKIICAGDANIHL